MKKLVVLSGAGMSAESGIKTFRDHGGLWEGHDVTQVASPQGWQADPEMVLSFYNQRRRQLLAVEPNLAHKKLADLEQYFNTVVITQNVDDLHERAGSSHVIHLHGELLKSQSTVDPRLVYPCNDDILLGDKCQLGGQLRPFIVWFGEQVPMLEHAVIEVIDADVIIIIGTSMQVYPAASLVEYANKQAQLFYIDPKPSINDALAQSSQLTIIKDTAVDGVRKLADNLLSQCIINK